jgi:hypothetical protein
MLVCYRLEARSPVVYFGVCEVVRFGFSLWLRAGRMAGRPGGRYLSSCCRAAVVARRTELMDLNKFLGSLEGTNVASKFVCSHFSCFV